MLLAQIFAAAIGLQVVNAAGGLEVRQSATQLTVDLSKTYQRIDGFGFSAAFQRSNTLYGLAPKDRKAVLDLLFNTTSGAGMTILRNGIGSSVDTRSDHMNTILPKSPGSPTAVPNYVWDGNDTSQLWLSQQAVSYGVKIFYANAWSAPAFMKTNNNENNGGSLCGVSGASCSSGDWRQAYANYLVQYIKYYKEAGVNITHLGFLNEPDFSASYASMQSSGRQAADFIKVLAPTIQAANLSVGITCCDATGWGKQTQMFSEIKSAGADSLLSTITTHAYSGSPNSVLSTNIPVWQTEWSDLQGGWSTAWYSNGGAGDGMTWANNIYSALTSANLSGYLFWEGIQHVNINGRVNEKLIQVNPDNTYNVSKRLWAFGQFARFVKFNALRVAVQGGNGNLKTSAFKNVDGSVAVQVLNFGSGAATVSVKGVPGTAVTAWLTDNTHDLDTTPAQIATDGVVTGSVPGRAMVTFVITS